MEEKIRIKKGLLKACFYEVERKRETIDQIIRSNRQALESETKSSAGDKHETGRAVLQLEMEKASQQFSIIDQMNETLKRISPDKVTKSIVLGSVVQTNGFNYFISVSLGKISFKNDDYYVVSARSPIGKELIGRKCDETLAFNGKTIHILDVF